jgi:hypothetical protein
MHVLQILVNAKCFLHRAMHQVDNDGHLSQAITYWVNFLRVITISSVPYLLWQIVLSPPWHRVEISYPYMPSMSSFYFLLM